MNQLTINITVKNGGILNINNYPAPYRTVAGKKGVIHTFYSKEELDEYLEERKEQR